MSSAFNRYRPWWTAHERHPIISYEKPKQSYAHILFIGYLNLLNSNNKIENKDFIPKLKIIVESITYFDSKMSKTEFSARHLDTDVFERIFILTLINCRSICIGGLL